MKFSCCSSCKRFVSVLMCVLMCVLLCFIAGEANAMLVRAKAKAEAIQLLAAALAQQVSHGSWRKPELWR